MTPSVNDAVGHARIGLALALANARYWPTVAPQVQRELRRWKRCALAIPDPTLRSHALAKLHDEHFNAQVAATLATIAPRPHRSRVVEAVVAFQVMYDYLDALGEEPATDPRLNGRQLFLAFTDALTPGAQPTDYYRYHPQHEDGGYLARLAATCQDALTHLPAASEVVSIARRAALACGRAQTLTHAISLHGTAPLHAWASEQAVDEMGLRWWEYAAGAAASSLTVHALLTAAADEGTTQQDACEIESAYLSICALSTLLDSLIDVEQDIRDGSHSFIAYYDDPATAARRIAAIARNATNAAHELRHAHHHAMTVAGVAGYYLSAPGATSQRPAPVAASVIQELRPIVSPVRVIFWLWRRAKQCRDGAT